jgi:small subunit ribosomal protein S6
MSDLVRKYEMIYIHPGNLAGEDVDQVTEIVTGTLEKMGGELIHREDWGVRALAYQVRKQSEGRYILPRFACAADSLDEIERRLRISEAVIKYLTVRLPDDFVQEEVVPEGEEAEAEAAPESAAPAAAPEAAAEEAPAAASEEPEAASAETETSDEPGEE